MCGIFAYSGTRTATPLLIEGLRALEYRGYDSAGIFVPGIGTVKAVGPIASLAKAVTTHGGTSGIAHTRWATHGEPTEVNAHPHQSADGRVMLVHNGIIENYRELRAMLTEKGHTFVSATDSEVLAHLIGSELTSSSSLLEAVRKALLQAKGTYGIAAMEVSHPDDIVVARMGSPLVIGVSPHGNFIASDPSALVEHTKDVVYLEDGELALITPSSYHIETLEREPRLRAVERIAWDTEQAKKLGYDHFMMKEIMEGPEVLRNSMRGRIIASQGLAKLGDIETHARVLGEAERITIVGCGSAYYTGMVAKYMLEKFVRIPVEIELASEFRYRSPVIQKNHVVIAVSQSGETADTLAAVREAKKLGALTLGIVNVVGSTIARETDAGIYNHAGPEAGVASTKGFLSQLVVFGLFTLYLARVRGVMSREEGVVLAHEFEALPEKLQRVLQDKNTIQTIATKYALARDFLFVGRTSHMPIAYEGALKLKEVSYVHAEGYGAGEMKHGPIAMIDADFPTVALMPNNEVFEKMVSNVEEIRARKGPVIAVTTVDAPHAHDVADDVICVPATHELLQPILSTVPLQLFAYYFGTAKGYDVDRPRNLAKSVTVE
ncbi:MAG: Glucosamine 6-phosphate synthetase [Candidatus Parcubacteria bacterium]